MNRLRTSSFLRQQTAALLVGSLATCASLYSIAGLVHAGLNTWFGDHRSSVADTFRGIPGVPNPGGSAAFGVVFPISVAALCWWGVISDWKRSRAERPSQKTEEPNKTSHSNRH